MKGFTLIELVIVIIIIVLLASGLVVLIAGLVERAKIDKTTGILKSVTDGCVAYRAEFHEWPPETPYSGSANLHYYLGREFLYEVQSGSSISSATGLANPKKKHPPIIEFRVDMLYKAASADPNPPVQVCDAWNRPMTYQIVLVGGVKQARIVSAGPDQIMGTSDDMTSDARPN